MVKKYIHNLPLKGKDNNSKIIPSYNNLLLPLNYNKSLLSLFKRSNREYIKPDNITKELVLYGTNLETSLNVKKYTHIVRNMIHIPNNILYILAGVILTDGHISYVSNKNIDKSIFNTSHQETGGYEDKLESLKYIDGIITKHNCRFRFKQSQKHAEYV
jgi:hypothetical protein|tara:strand:- start:18441 stop:18917 length:477 start_codon:yes stop_codon:yes gene_type:complete